MGPGGSLIPVMREARESAAFLKHCRKSPQPTECVVVDAVSYELVSAAKFPDIREFTGNFLRFAGNWPPRRIKNTCQIGRYDEIPYATEEGIFKGVTSKNREMVSVQASRAFTVARWR